MNRIPIYLDGELTAMEVKRIFNEAGLYLHTDTAGRFVVDRVPKFLLPDTNVVPMRKRKVAT